MMSYNEHEDYDPDYELSKGYKIHLKEVYDKAVIDEVYLNDMKACFFASGNSRECDAADWVKLDGIGRTRFMAEREALSDMLFVATCYREYKQDETQKGSDK